MPDAAPASWSTAIVWFRRDLRVTDHPALQEAIAQAKVVVPLYVLDERLLGAAAPARRWFLHRSLRVLDVALRDRGGALLVRRGEPAAVVAQVAREFGAQVVLATRDVTPFSHRRDRAVASSLEADGRRLALRPGLLLAEPETLLTSGGTPYGVFTPFWRALQRAPRRALLAAPDRLPAPAGLADASDPRASTFDELDPPLEGLPAPGEEAARERLAAWVHGGLAAYGSRRNELSGEGSSHLGADLHLGTLSPLQVETAASELGTGAEPFVRQLAWREFYHHLLFHQRDRGAAWDHPLMAAFRGEADDAGAVAAWREGRTGVPVVDAAMRQLAATGWMSNRARLIVASYLTRHLLMDPRIGERHFMRHLVDGDLANNRGGWGWTAGVGADPQPWFRIFNPQLQGQRFDPQGDWVRRWVPELERAPARYVHAPWEMPDELQAATGVRIGRSYPAPIVGLAEGRQRALEAFRAASGGDGDRSGG